eukprot:SAG25_NODE_1742_length_2413_cov_3.351340_1_plen_73_part_10
MRASDARSRYDPYGLAKVYQAPLVGLAVSVVIYACCLAATFEQDAYQRIGIALQRGIISDQLARAHARRTRNE